MRMRRGALSAGLAAAACMTAAACERPERSGDAEAMLTLTVETPDALDWGSTGALRITLANEGEFASEGGIIEVHVPDWLEFGPIEPAGTEVTVVSGDGEMRLSYAVLDSIAAGERRTIVQHLRVHAPPAPPRQFLDEADTVETVQLAPSNQVVRARLLRLDGQPAGAEVQATIHFVGAAGTIAPRRDPADTFPADTAAGAVAPAPDTVPPDTVPRRVPPGAP
jgi:hypothetical protein